MFLGYSLTSKAYRVFSKRTLVVEESIHVFYDVLPLANVDDMCANLDRFNFNDKDDNNELKEEKSNELENLDACDQPSSLDLPKE